MANKRVIVFDPSDRSYDSLGKLFGSVVYPYDWKDIYTEMFIDEVLSSRFVLLTGGTDINPAMYGEERNGAYPPHDVRDDAERVLLELCLRNNIPVVGICRGAQMLNVFNDGKLLQHFDGHQNTTHPAILWSGKSEQVTGDHHQVILPSDHAVVLGQSKDDGVAEIVAWPVSNMLGFQYHPEWMSQDSPAYHTFIHLTSELLNGTIGTYIVHDVRGAAVSAHAPCGNCGDCACS